MEYGSGMDPLASVSYNAASGAISFVRPLKKYRLPDQTYSGTLSSTQGQLVMRDPGRQLQVVAARGPGYMRSFRQHRRTAVNPGHH